MARKMRAGGVPPHFFAKDVILKGFRLQLYKNVIAKGFRQSPYKSMILRRLVLSR